MKSQIALLALLALSTIGGFYMNSMESSSSLQEAAQNMDFEAFQAFTAWKAKHAKNYDMQNDEMYRFTVFAENYDFAKTHNAANNSTVKLGMTVFADLTNKEFLELISTNIVDPVEEDADTIIPGNMKKFADSGDWESISWQEKGAVTSVKNQGSCGGCWAFASTAALETLRFEEDEVLESLSNQQMLSCADIPIAGAGGCNGGNSYYAFAYSQSTSMVPEQYWSYQNGDVNKALPCKLTAQEIKQNGVFSNTGQVNVAKNNPQAVYTALQEHVMYVSINGGSIYFQLYSGGVLDNTGCTPYTNHAVALVGYTQETNSWTIKNSWGTGWGEQGFANVAVVDGKGICGIQTKPAYPTYKD